MRRVVSLFLPTWSTDRLRRTLCGAAPPAETPLVLIGREGGAAETIARFTVKLTGQLFHFTPLVKATL